MGLQQAFEYFQTRQFAEALAACDRALAQSPDCAIAHQLRGEILVELHRLEEAAAAYETAIECDRQRPEPYAYLGELHDRQNDCDRAIQLYQHALSLRPDWPTLRYNLARLYLQQGNYPVAQKHYEKAIELNPEDAKSHNDLGTIYQRWGHLERAKTYYQKAIALDRSRLHPQRNLAALFLQQNRPHDARRVLQTALLLDPQNAELHHLQGSIDLALDRNDAALASYLRSLQLDPHLAAVREDLGKLFDRLQLPAAALTSFQQAIELDGDRLDLYGYCAQMALRLQRPELALAYFRESLTRMSDRDFTWLRSLLHAPSPTPADAYNKAWAARQRFLQSLCANADLETSRRSLGDLYRCWGDVRLASESFPEAEAYYETALNVDAGNLEAERGLGATRVRQQRQQQSRDSSQHRTFPIPDGLILNARSWLEQHPTARHFPLQEARCGDRERLSVGSVKPWRLEIAATESVGVNGIDPSSCADSMNFQSAQADFAPVGAVLTARSAGHSCAGINCQPCLTLIQQAFDPIGLSDDLYCCPPTSQLPEFEVDRFTAEIPNGRIWTMPQKSWWQVCEAIAVMTPDSHLVADLSREYPGQLPGCPYAIANLSQHRIFRQKSLPPLQKIEGTIAVLCGLSANVYFHWMVDILPRLGILRRSGFPEGEIERFYVNSIARPFQQQTLELLGIPLDRVIESDRYPHIEATCLVVPSFPSYLGWATPEALEFLRSSFLPIALASPLFSNLQPMRSLDRIYIARRGACYRQIINETEVIEILQQRGFTSVDLETYSILEQVQLFANAKAIVAPHGAGLTNLIFCQPGTTAIELFSPNYIRHYYWSICRYLQLNHYYLIGHALPCQAFRQLLYPDVLTEDFWVDVESLQILLDNVGLGCISLLLPSP